MDWFTCWSVIQGLLDTMNMVAPADGDVVLAAYFDCGALWGNIEHVMSLTLPELQLYLQHAARIRSAVKQG
jgi:hypothetical protein